MTAIADKLYDEVTKIVYKVESMGHRKLLFISDFQFRTQMNLLLLKHFLQERKQQGIFITFDRPHQYISKVLHKMDVDQSKLTYIDAVSFISGEMSQGTGSNVRFVRGPYQIGLFKNLVGRCFNEVNRPGQIVDIKDVDFIMIDDISALSIYNEIDDIKEFTNNFFSFADSINSFAVALVMDAKHNRDIYQIMSKNCEIQVHVNPSKYLVKLVSNRRRGAGKSFEIIPRPISVRRTKSKDVII